MFCKKFIRADYNTHKELRFSASPIAIAGNFRVYTAEFAGSNPFDKKHKHFCYP